MQRPTLSVCIPNFNYGHFLRSTLLSVLKQSWPPDEVWVLDDASTDNSADVVTELARQYPQLHLVRNPVNLGAAANIARIWSLARCELVYCLGSDDMVAPGFFEASCRLLARYPQAALCCADAHFLDVHGRPLAHGGPDLAPRGGFLTVEQLVAGYHRTRHTIAGSQAVFRREALMAADVMRTDLGPFVDTLYVHGLAFRSGICYQQEAPALIRVHSQGFASLGRADTRKTLRQCQALLQVLDEPAHRAVRDGFVRSGILGSLPRPILRAALAHRGGMRYLTPWFMRRWLRTLLAELSYPLRRALRHRLP